MVNTTPERVKLHREAMPLALALVDKCIGMRDFVQLPSGEDLDMLYLRQGEMLIKARIRDRETFSDKYANQFTLRSRPRSEREMIEQEDFCDWYFYGFCDRRRKIIEPWCLVDVNKLYKWPGLLTRAFAAEKPNFIDSKYTLFQAFWIDEFPESVIPHTSSAIKRRPRFFEVA